MTASADGPPRSRRAAPWLLLLVLTLLLAALVPLAWDGRYYFRGDTQNAYLGWWFHLGSEVRSGHWPLLDLQSWRAGNFTAEGQWGVFSPLTIAIGVLTSAVSDLVVLVTVVKMAVIVVNGLGVYLLTRSYGAHRPAAYVAGVLVPLCGEAQLLEWPSWVYGQLVAALLPWCWWGIRRTMRGAHPGPALLAGYLVVTVGYVYGTLYLVVVVVACLVECALERNRRGALRVVVVGVVCGLVAVAVYLPGVLTAPVTGRAGWDVVASGSAVVDPTGLFASMLPFPPSHGAVTQSLYVAWVLPMLAWVDLGRYRQSWRSLSGLVVVLVVMLLWAFGPSRVGPLRWPGRTLPILVLAVVVLGVVLLDRTAARPPTGRRLVVSVLWTLAAGYLTFWQDDAGQRITVVGTVLVVTGLVVVWSLLRLARPAAAAAALVVGASCVGVVALQHHYRPHPPAVDRNSPRYAADYRTQLPDARGDVLVLGNPEPAAIRHAAVSRRLLIAAAWYLNPHPVQNTYTTIKFRGYDSALCMRYNGSTMCPGVLRRVQAVEPGTGTPWLDLLSVSTVVLFRPDFPEPAQRRPPVGWHVADSDRWTTTWVRDHPVPTAGGVVWTSPGVRVGGTVSSDRDLRFRVSGVPASGGRVVLSRLAWPGYGVRGATIGPPLSGRLLTVDLPAGSAGRTVEVHYSPPGWGVELTSWWLGVCLAIGWSLLAPLRRLLAGRAGHSAADGAAPVPGP
jgi:hypothetical protein